MKLALNSLWLLLARLGSQALALALTSLIARRLGADGLGQYAFIAALMLLGNAATTFGTDSLIIRAAPPRPALLSAALWLQLSLAALWTAAMALLPVGSAAVRPGLMVYSLALFPLAFYTVATAALRAHERMDLLLRASLLSAALQVGCALAAFSLRQDLLSLCLGLLLAHIAASLAAGIIGSRNLPGFELYPRVPLAQVWGVARAAALLAALTALGVLAQRLNIIAVATLMSDAATGWFAAGARVVEGLKAGHLALLGALFPVLARRPLPGVLRRALVLLLLLAAGLALAASLSARPIILLLYGPRFEASVDALQWQAWTLVPYTVTAVISLWFVATGAERSVLFGSALSLPVMLALYIFLIPRLGWLGAAWAMLGGECLQAVVFAVMFILQPRRANELVMDAFGV